MCYETKGTRTAVPFVFSVPSVHGEKGTVVLSWGIGIDVDDVIVEADGGKIVTVPGSWVDGYGTLLAAHYGDKAVCANSMAANGRMSVAECYVVGLDPEDGSATNDFRITSFPMKADGTPDLEHIVFDPPQERWNVKSARPVIKGAASLDGPWREVGGDGHAGRVTLPEDFRFFKVEVVLP